MRHGIVILADQPWSVAAQRWRRAEEYGFDHAWTYDHVGWRELVDEPWFDAVPTLTAAAAVTSRIRIGTLVASPLLRHPASFARTVTALDDISSGRLLLGIGAGGTDFDARVFGGSSLDPGPRAARFEEFVELLDTILVDAVAPGDHVTSSGRYFSTVQARSTPGCVQQPRVPFVLAANGPRTMALAARLGQGWVTSAGIAQTPVQYWDLVAERVAVFDRVLARTGRDPSTIDRYLSLDPSPRYSLTSPDTFAACVRRAEALGFTDVITHWPRPSGWFAGDERVLAEVAATFPRPARVAATPAAIEFADVTGQARPTASPALAGTEEAAGGTTA